MSHRTRLLTAFAVVYSLHAIDAGRDFSGKWNLDADQSDVRSLAVQPERRLEVVQQDSSLRCSSPSAHWSYALDGSESRYKLGGEDRNSVAKWEGAALLINTLVSGAQQYAEMDRWKLSRDHSVLTINRQIDRAGRQTEAVLVYRREDGSGPVTAAVRRDQDPSPPSQPLARREPALPAPKITVKAGTRVPLVLLNTVDTKHSREGDRIYLQTQFPIAIDNQIVIPRGSSVIGAVTKSKPAGRVQGKGELYVRFDSLTLPNGVTRDFRARLSSADAGNGKVDPEEGKVEGERDKADAARKIGGGAAGGGSVGVLTGGIAGHPGMGAGIGAAAGGLAGILLSKRPEATLPKGTTVEMILDRDLEFRADELRF